LLSGKSQYGMLIQRHGGNDMLDVLYELSSEFEIPTLDGEECTILISSDDNVSCNIVYNILVNVFLNNELIFKASGFPDNINCVLEMIHNCSPIHFEGDSKKFFVKKQPEVYAKISDKKVLSDIINDWTSTVYERRFLYVLKEGQFNHLRDIIEKNVYVDSNNLLSSWTHLNCLIENAPDAKNHNTFILTFRKEYLCEIKKLLG